MTGPSESIGKGGIPHINAATRGAKLFGIPVKEDPTLPDGVIEFRDPWDDRAIARYDLATGADIHIVVARDIGSGRAVDPLRDPPAAVEAAPDLAARVIARARCLAGSMAEGDRDRLMEALDTFDRAVIAVRASRAESRPPEQEG